MGRRLYEELVAHDGDTFYDSGGGNGLRIGGINTPESHQFGNDEALALAREYENGFTTTEGERGFHGRRLGDRETEDGRVLSHELLGRGLANTYGSDSTHRQRAIEDDFRMKRSGLMPLTEQEQNDVDFYRQKQDAAISQIKNSSVGNQITKRLPGDFHTDALARGVDQVQQMGYGFAKLIGEAIGSDSMEEWARKGIDTQAMEMLLNPRATRSFTESEGFVESVSSLYESVIEQVPNIGVTIAASLASGGMGGLIGRKVASRIASGEIAATKATQEAFKKAMAVGPVPHSQMIGIAAKQAGGNYAKRGAAAGAATTSVGMNTGETKITFDREGIDDNSLAAFVGLVKGSLDMVALAAIPSVNRLLGMGLRKAGGKVTRAQLFKEVPFKVMKALVAEGTTEAIQQVADIVAVNHKKGRAWSEEDTKSVIEAFAVGAAAGKAFAIPGAIIEAATGEVISDSGSPPSAEAPNTEGPSGSSPRTEVPSADVPSADVPSADVPSADVGETPLAKKRPLDLAKLKDRLAEAERDLDFDEAARLRQLINETEVESKITPQGVSEGSLDIAREELVLKIRSGYDNGASFDIEDGKGTVTISGNTRESPMVLEAFRQGVLIKHKGKVELAPLYKDKTDEAIAESQGYIDEELPGKKDRPGKNQAGFFGVSADELNSIPYIEKLGDADTIRAELGKRLMLQHDYNQDKRPPSERGISAAQYEVISEEINRLAAMLKEVHPDTDAAGVDIVPDKDSTYEINFADLENPTHPRKAVFVAAIEGDKRFDVDDRSDLVTLENRAKGQIRWAKGKKFFEVVVNGDQKGRMFFRDYEEAYEYKKMIERGVSIRHANGVVLDLFRFGTHAEVIEKDAAGDPARVFILIEVDSQGQEVGEIWSVLSNKSRRYSIEQFLIGKGYVTGDAKKYRLVETTPEEGIKNRLSGERRAFTAKVNYLSGVIDPTDPEGKKLSPRGRKARKRMVAPTESYGTKSQIELEPDYESRSFSQDSGMPVDVSEKKIFNRRVGAYEPSRDGFFDDDGSYIPMTEPVEGGPVAKPKSQENPKTEREKEIERLRREEGVVVREATEADRAEAAKDIEREREAARKENEKKKKPRVKHKGEEKETRAEVLAATFDAVGARKLTLGEQAILAIKEEANFFTEGVEGSAGVDLFTDEEVDIASKVLSIATESLTDDEILDTLEELGNLPLSQGFLDDTQTGLGNVRLLRAYSDNVLDFELLESDMIEDSKVEEGLKGRKEDNWDTEPALVSRMNTLNVNQRGLVEYANDLIRDPDAYSSSTLRREIIKQIDIGAEKSRLRKEEREMHKLPKGEQNIRIDLPEEVREAARHVREVITGASLNLLSLPRTENFNFRESSLQRAVANKIISQSTLNSPKKPKSGETLVGGKEKITAQDVKEKTKSPFAFFKDFAKQLRGLFENPQELQVKLQKALAELARGKDVVTLSREEVLKLVEDVYGASNPLGMLYKRIFIGLPTNLTVDITRGKYAAGNYKAKGGKITLTLSNGKEVIRSGWYGEALLHELLHGATMYHSALADIAIRYLGSEASVATLVKRFKNGTLKGVSEKDKRDIKALLDAQSTESLQLVEDLLRIYTAFKNSAFGRGEAPAYVGDKRLFVTEITAKENLASVTEFIATSLSNNKMLEAMNGMSYNGRPLQKTAKKSQKSDVKIGSLLDYILKAIKHYFGFGVADSFLDKTAEVSILVAEDNLRVVANSEGHVVGEVTYKDRYSRKAYLHNKEKTKKVKYKGPGATIGFDNPHYGKLFEQEGSREFAENWIQAVAQEQVVHASSEVQSNITTGINDITKPSERFTMRKVARFIKEMFSKEKITAGWSVLKDYTAPLLSSNARLSRISKDFAGMFYKVPGAIKGGIKNAYINVFHSDAQKYKTMLHDEVYFRFPRKGRKARIDKMFKDYYTGIITEDVKLLKTFLKKFHDHIGSSSVEYIAKLGQSLGSDIPVAFDTKAIENNYEGFIKFLFEGNVDSKGKSIPFTYLDNAGTERPFTESLARKYAAGLLNRGVAFYDTDGGDLTVRAPAAKKQLIPIGGVLQQQAARQGFLLMDAQSTLEFHISTLVRQKARDEVFGHWARLTNNDAVLLEFLNKHGYWVSNLKIDSKTGEVIESDRAALAAAVNHAIARGLLKKGRAGIYKYFDPDFYIRDGLRKIGEQQGSKAYHEAKKIIMGYDGLLGLNMPDGLKKVVDWAMVAQAYMLLAFSVITSLPELGVLLTLSGGKDMGSAVKGITSYFRSLKDSKEHARSMGIISEALLVGAYMDGSQPMIEGNMSRLALEKLFIYNGNTFFTNTLRAMSFKIGIEYMQTVARDAEGGGSKASVAKKELERWGTTSAEVNEWVSEGMPSMKGNSSHPMSVVMLNYVDTHVARPVSANKMTMANDKRFALITHMKSFFYAYAATILPEFARIMALQYSKGSAVDRPALAAGVQALFPLLLAGAVTYPLAMLANGTKQAIRGLSEDDDDRKRKQKWLDSRSDMDYFIHTLRSTGWLGPADLVWSYYDEETRGGSALTRVLGPSFGALDTLLAYGPTDPRTVKRFTPIVGTVAPGLYHDWIKEAQKERRQDRKLD